MCDDQRVDHDPNAAIELPEDVGVRHDVACARKAAQSVRVSIGAAAQRRGACVVCATHLRRQVSPPLAALDTNGYTGSPLVNPTYYCS